MYADDREKAIEKNTQRAFYYAVAARLIVLGALVAVLIAEIVWLKRLSDL